MVKLMIMELHIWDTRSTRFVCALSQLTQRPRCDDNLNEQILINFIYIIIFETPTDQIHMLI